MAVCPSCGAFLVPPYRFCPSCGKAVPDKLPYPPAYPPVANYPPPKKNNTVMIIVVIVIVIIVVSVALPAILYVMVSGLIGNGPNLTAKPAVTLTVTKITGGVSILVAGIVPSTNPSNFKVNIENATDLATGTPVAMPTVSGTSVQVVVSGVTFTIRWNNIGGSGVVSQGDTFVVTYTAAAGTSWYFLLIWAGDGSVLPTGTGWQT